MHFVTQQLNGKTSDFSRNLLQGYVPRHNIKNKTEEATHEIGETVGRTGRWEIVWRWGRIGDEFDFDLPAAGRGWAERLAKPRPQGRARRQVLNRLVFGALAQGHKNTWRNYFESFWR